MELRCACKFLCGGDRFGPKRVIGMTEIRNAQDRIAERRDKLIAAAERQFAVQATWSERFVVEWRLV